MWYVVWVSKMFIIDLSYKRETSYMKHLCQAHSCSTNHKPNVHSSSGQANTQLEDNISGSPYLNIIG